MSFDLNGAWFCNDGGIYYVRQQGDRVTWAGLHASGFHAGIVFSNVFQGRVASDGVTVMGEWVDVPRGGTNRAGALGFTIVEVQVPAPPPPHLPPGEPSPPDGPGILLELRVISQATTGGFGGSVWSQNALSLEALDIVTVDGEVQRYDVPLGANNPPCRDFSVMWGSVGRIDGPTLPPGGSDYCSFLNDDWDGDGDFDFDINPDWSRIESSFWTKGWVPRTFIEASTFGGAIGLPANAHILRLFDNYQRFHCEAAMFGRQNDSDHCADTPVILLPGWNETGGNSVLVNGRPIEGGLSVATDHRSIPGAPPPPNNALVFNFPDGTTLTLSPAALVRVTGVVADDAGHEGQTAPEIHPIYAIDIAQDFSQPRARNFNLTGVWHADDVGTYYMRQIGTALWWLGMSRDQGRSFANVFHGTIEGSSIEGIWVDVPIGAGGILGGGSLMLFGDGAATQLVKTGEVGAFGGTSWIKLYDTPATLPAKPTPPKPPIGPVKI